MHCSWQPIVSFVDNKYEEYLNAESKVNRKTTPDDNRVHCCLYFIAPTGHRSVVVDIELVLWSIFCVVVVLS